MPRPPYHRQLRTSARIPLREARYRASQRGRRRRRRPAHVLSWAPSFHVVETAWTQATPIFLLRDTRSGVAFPVDPQIKPIWSSHAARAWNPDPGGDAGG